MARGPFALGEIGVFVGILFVGLVYVWVKRDLEWLKSVPVAAERAGSGAAGGVTGDPMSLINSVPEMALTTKADEFLNWTRKSSVWCMLFGLACCAIEMMQTDGPRADVDRFGAAPRATPRVSPT